MSADGIEPGQVWRHHSAGDYRVQYLVPMAKEYGVGKVKVKLAQIDGDGSGLVWPDYLRANFRLQAGSVEAPTTPEAES